MVAPENITRRHLGKWKSCCTEGSEIVPSLFSPSSPFPFLILWALGLKYLKDSEKTQLLGIILLFIHQKHMQGQVNHSLSLLVRKQIFNKHEVY